MENLWVLFCTICFLVCATIYVQKRLLKGQSFFTCAWLQLNYGGGRASIGPQNKTCYLKRVKEHMKAINEISNNCGSLQISIRQCQRLGLECQRLVNSDGTAQPDSIFKESYCAVRRALKLMQDCCTENWLLKAVEFGNCQEHFLDILLDLHRLPIVKNLLRFRGESLDEMLPETFRSTNIYAAVKGDMFPAWESDGIDLRSRVVNEIRHDDPVAEQLTENPSLLAPPEILSHITEFNFLKTPYKYRGADDIVVFSVTFRNREFVIKMRCSEPLAEELNNSRDITLQNEANTMKDCRHPYAVGLLGYWEVTRTEGSTVPFLLMEFMECDLKELIQRNKKTRWWGGTRGFPALDAINLMLPVAKVMRHLHRIGFVHRDLKPQNIMFTQHLHEDISVKLADFGDARKVGGSGVGDRVGTYGYMDPVVRNRIGNVDLFKADVFSFGMVFGEVLTGLSPAEALHCISDLGDGRVDAVKLYGKLEGEERPPLPMNTPKFVKSIVKSCWASDPVKRPSFEDICWKLQNTEFLLVNCIGI